MDIKEALEVVGHRVLIEPVFIEAETDWGFKMDVGNDYLRQKAATETGYIRGIGPNAWLAFDNGEPWAKEGDEVMFARHAGRFVEWEGKEYMVLNDEDILLKVHRS